MTERIEIDCSAAEAQLPLYVGGDVDALEAERLGVHLATCRPCAAALARAAAARAAFRAELLDQEPPAGGLWPGIEAQLRAARAEGAGAAPAAPVGTARRTWIARAALLAAAAGLAAVTVPRLQLGNGAGVEQPVPLANVSSSTADAGATAEHRPETIPAAFALRRLAFDEPTLGELAGARLLQARPYAVSGAPGSAPATQFASHLLR
jgi:anti-sigma factor RsiW